MKKLNIKELLNDYAVHSATSGSKHTMPGWINMHCPFCEGPQDYHLGFHEKKEYFHCWRCNWHPLESTIATLINHNIYKTKEIIQQYRTGRPIIISQTDHEIQRPNEVKLPGNDITNTSPHYKYLLKRGFKPERISELIFTYNLKGTGPVGPYSFRIIAPIYFDGNLVSYQGRDYTNKSTLKYKACPKIKEVMDHKNCLYAMDLSRGDTVIIVEGIIDAWKLGSDTVATFGSSFTWAQIKLLAQRWKNRIVLFDADAKTQAYRLANALSAFPGKTSIAFLNDLKDPGESTHTQTQEIIEELKKGEIK